MDKVHNVSTALNGGRLDNEGNHHRRSRRKKSYVVDAAVLGIFTGARKHVPHAMVRE
jgi:hypothetical protein